ncbi:MAG: type II toxin-antitoxin system RelE/ParE family toxin [Treponema sp.]|nr:type II toxin-antitoxin system RelE/ParE family toxin [Treponema sp.]
MAYSIAFESQAEKEFSKLDKTAQQNIFNYLKKLSTLENPRLLGKSLKGNFSDFWRYRVGDYRVICDIDDERILVTVVRIGHRKDVYK